MLSPGLCDYSDAYILVKGTITMKTKQLKFKQIKAQINR